MSSQAGISRQSLPKLSALTSRLLDTGLNQAADLALPPACAAAKPPQDAAKAKRVKLWELEDKHHCPVIGTCLDIADLQRLARRFKFAASPRQQFAMHTEAVGHSRSRNPVSEAMQRCLDAKYELWLARFAKLKSDAEVGQAWKECLARGEIAGPLWAAYTHKAAAAETRQAIFADIHMLSHQVGAGQAADSRRLAQLEKENAELRAGMERERSQQARDLAAMRQELADCAGRLAKQSVLQAEFDAMRLHLARVESDPARLETARHLAALQSAREQLRASAQRVAELENQLQAVRAEAESCARECDAMAAEREALERLLLASADARAEDCGGQCESCGPAGQRCILYVGGRTSMVHHYRKLAERLGVRLIHHDGGLEEALSRLPDMIHGADAIVCPTDCVSHSAYHHLKNHCKRAGKPCLFFRGAGVSSFALAMSKIASGEFSLAGEMPAAV